MMGIYAVLAEAFRYPDSLRLESLESQYRELPPGPVKELMMSFLQRVQMLSLHEWESLYTTTFDLNPTAPPYIGYMIWGDQYQRGQFLAQLSGSMRTADIDQDDELPDHLVPVLRYMDKTPGVWNELGKFLLPAVRAMQESLEKADPDNPYLNLLSAALLAFAAEKETSHVLE
ncbi:MAG TPA: hypothetical protein PKD55_06635 [Bellilinea sp.]|nr:hypothetical protein [Bellilinea sp.]